MSEFFMPPEEEELALPEFSLKKEAVKLKLVPFRHGISRTLFWGG